MNKAIDVSSAPPITASQADCLKRQGITKIIVGTSYPYGGSPKQRIEAARLFGFEVAEYQFPQFRQIPLTDEVWIDVETPPGATADLIRASMATQQRPVGIYSSRTMWSATVGSYNVKAEFPWLKVWAADYGSLPRPFKPFGGFVEADLSMMQYKGDTEICSMSVDLNLIIEQPMEEEQMPRLVHNTTDGKLYLVGFQQPIWITSTDEVAALEKAYGPRIDLSNDTMQQMVT